MGGGGPQCVCLDLGPPLTEQRVSAERGGRLYHRPGAGGARGCAGRGLRPVTRVWAGGWCEIVSPPPYLRAAWVPPSDLNSPGGGRGAELLPTCCCGCEELMVEPGGGGKQRLENKGGGGPGTADFGQ